MPVALFLRDRRVRFTALVTALIATSAIAYWLSRGDRAAEITLSPTEAGADVDGPTATPRFGPATPAVAKATKNKDSLLDSAYPAALPPPDAPLAQTYENLRLRADAGDAAAASRLYHDVGRCLHTRDVLTNRARTASWMLEDDTSRLDSNQLSRREQRLAEIEEELSKARASSGLCEGATPEQLQLAPVALRAAQLGNTQAADCYVSAGLIAGAGLLDHPEWLQDYKNNALLLANAAIAQGDWSMVGQLQRAYSQSTRAGLLSQVTGADPARSYAYLKLRSLGAATPQGVSFLGRQLADAAKNLPPDVVAQGDTWAQRAFQQYFAGKPQIDTTRGVNACQNIGGE